MKQVTKYLGIGAIILLFVLTLVGLVGLFGMVLDASWSFLPESGADAAWAQAIGTLLALLVAIIIPWVVHWQERQAKIEEDRLNGGSLAAAIYPALLQIGVVATRNERDFSKMVDDVNSPLAMALHADPERILKSYKHDIPRVLTDNTMNYHLLGRAPCIEVQQLVALMAQFEVILDEMIKKSTREADLSRSITLVRPVLSAISELAQSARNSVGEVHDQVVLPKKTKSVVSALDVEEA